MGISIVDYAKIIRQKPEICKIHDYGGMMSNAAVDLLRNIPEDKLPIDPEELFDRDTSFIRFHRWIYRQVLAELIAKNCFRVERDLIYPGSKYYHWKDWAKNCFYIISESRTKNLQRIHDEIVEKYDCNELYNSLMERVPESLVPYVSFARPMIISKNKLPLRIVGRMVCFRIRINKITDGIKIKRHAYITGKVLFISPLTIQTGDVTWTTNRPIFAALNER